MYKKIYKIIIFILTLCIVFFNYTYSCYANTTHIPQEFISILADLYETMEGTQQASQNTIKNFISKSFDSVGFLIDETGLTLEKIKNIIGQTDSNTTISSDQDVADWIVNNVSVSGDNVVFGNQYKSFIKNYADEFINENSISNWYCCSVQLSSSADLVSGFLEDAVPIMDQYRNNCLYVLWGGSNNVTYFFVIPRLNCEIYGVQSSVINSNWHGFNLYRCKEISGVITYEPIKVRDTECTVYIAGSDGHLTQVNDHSTINGSFTNVNLGAYYYVSAGHGTDGHDWKTYPKGISKYGDYIPTFLTENALDTYIHSTGVGLKSYYYNNQVWNNFNSSQGDYTVDNSNVNVVTYGDTVSNIIDSYNTTGYYPDIDTTNSWIETTNNNYIDDSGGGGSGGSGDDSGGSGSIGDIFGWLKTLGQALGSLIKGVGEFLSEIISGLVSAITDLLDSISELLTGVLESLTNIFSGLISFIFDGLPEEVTNVLYLALTVAILITVIRLIRGN